MYNSLLYSKYVRHTSSINSSRRSVAALDPTSSWPAWIYSTRETGANLFLFTATGVVLELAKQVSVSLSLLFSSLCQQCSIDPTISQQYFDEFEVFWQLWTPINRLPTCPQDVPYRILTSGVPFFVTVTHACGSILYLQRELFSMTPSFGLQQWPIDENFVKSSLVKICFRLDTVWKQFVSIWSLASVWSFHSYRIMGIL